MIDTNILGTANVLLVAKELGTLERIVLTSTSEVYGSAFDTPIDEQHPLQAQSPYSATKIASDALGISFNRSFGMPITIVRPFNAYGPRQSARAVIPTIISQALTGTKAEAWGDRYDSRLHVCGGHRAWLRGGGLLRCGVRRSGESRLRRRNQHS